MALKYRAYRTCQWIDTTSTAQKIWGFWKLNITRQHSTMTTSVIARRLQGTQTGPEYRTQSMHRQTLYWYMYHSLYLYLQRRHRTRVQDTELLIKHCVHRPYCVHDTRIIKSISYRDMSAPRLLSPLHTNSVTYMKLWPASSINNEATDQTGQIQHSPDHTFLIH